MSPETNQTLRPPELQNLLYSHTFGRTLVDMASALQDKRSRLTAIVCHTTASNQTLPEVSNIYTQESTQQDSPSFRSRIAEITKKNTRIDLLAYSHQQHPPVPNPREVHKVLRLPHEAIGAIIGFRHQTADMPHDQVGVYLFRQSSKRPLQPGTLDRLSGNAKPRAIAALLSLAGVNSLLMRYDTVSKKPSRPDYDIMALCR